MENVLRFLNIKRMLRSSAVQDVGFLTIAQYLATIFGILTTVIAARILGPEGYGQAALILAFPTLLLSLGSFKSITVSTRYLAAFRATGKIKQLQAMSKLGYIIDLGAFLFVFIIVLLTGQWVSTYFYRAPWMAWPMAIYAASLPVLAFKGGSFAILTSFEKFQWLSLLYILERGSTFVLTSTFLVLGYGVTGFVLGMALGNILIGVSSLTVATSLLIRNGIGPWWRGSLSSIRSLRSELFSFYIWNYLATSLSGAIAQAPVMLLGSIRGEEEAGFFRLAFVLMTVSAYPMSAAGKVVYPHLSGRQAGGEPDASLKQSLKRWTLRGGFLLGFTVFGFIILLPLLVPFLFGEQYRSMVPGAQVLLVATVVEAIFFWLSPYYYAMGRIREWTKAFALYTIFVLGVGGVIIPAWGFWGMAMIFAAGKILFHIILVWKAMRATPETSEFGRQC